MDGRDHIANPLIRPTHHPPGGKERVDESEGGERERESRLGGRGWGLVAPAQKGQKSLRLSLYGRVTRSQPRSSLRYLQNQGLEGETLRVKHKE